MTHLSGVEAMDFQRRETGCPPPQESWQTRFSLRPAHSCRAKKPKEHGEQKGRGWDPQKSVSYWCYFRKHCDGSEIRTLKSKGILRIQWWKTRMDNMQKHPQWRHLTEMKENVIKEENMSGKREYRKIKMGTMHWISLFQGNIYKSQEAKST